MAKRAVGTVALLFFIVLFSIPAGAASLSTTPHRKANGKKYRIAYIQGGPYFEYDQVFFAVVKALQQLGWINPRPIPPHDAATARDLYAYLTRSDASNYLEFPKNAFYDADWKDARRAANKAALSRRIDLDMVFAYGTWAGQDLKTMPPDFKVPTVVMDVSDALQAGIVDSNTDSGRDNLTARVDPLRYQRQIGLFHDIIGFKKLGMAYEDTKEGRSYAAISDVEKMAKKDGFTIVRALHKGYVQDKTAGEKWLISAVAKLAPKIDAFYFTQQLALNQDSLPKLLEILDRHRVPTFSQTGSSEVKQGVLLSIATSGFKYVAAYHAKKIAEILNGATPRALPLIFDDPAKIAINLKTAQKIGFDPPVDILGAADEIYTQ